MRPFRREYDYFLLMCRTLNLSKAASEAGIQQAGLSKALRSLEEQFGKPLFHRSNRGLQLTAYGEIVRDLLRRTHAEWDHSLENELSKLTEVIGTYRLGAHQIVATNLFPNFFPSLNEDHPGLNLKLDLKRSGDVTKDVIDFKLDFGIVAAPLKHPDLVIVPLRKETMACWGRSKSPRKQVLYYNGEMIEAVETLKAFQSYKLTEINDYELLANLAMQSNGVAMLPSPVAARYPKLVQVGRTVMNVEICLVYRHDSVKTAAFKEIIKRIKEGLL